MPWIKVMLLVRSIARAHSSLRESVDFLGSIGCVLAPKICGGTRTHEISKTQKLFGEISPGVHFIQIINYFEWSLS